MNSINPYNCTKPGNLFVGYERLRRRLIQGLRNGNSFAILGGRRCGKTSLLLQVAQNVRTNDLTPFTPLPRFLDIQGLGPLTPNLLFATMYSLVAQDVAAQPWVSGEAGNVYQDFLQHLDTAKPILDQHYGPDWVVILLIDELDTAIASLPDDQFFQNLRNLLMISRLHRHFRLVASGVNEMASLISSGSSPLNNLRHMHLGILTGNQARQLIDCGFSDGLEPEMEFLLFQLTGRHPYLLQGFLETVWEEQGGLDQQAIKSAARAFLREHRTFHRWLDAFGPAERAVYQCLSETPDGTLHVREVRHRLEPPFAPHIDDALTVLSYHGVIDDSDPDEPRIASTLFRDWYQDHKPEPDDISSQQLASIALQPDRLERRLPASQTAIHVQVNPTIEVSGEVRSGPTVEEVLEIYAVLQTELSQIPLTARVRMEACHALEKGRMEIEEPQSGGQPNKEIVKSALEQATGIIKSAGTAAEATSTFVEKAQKLAPYLGQAAGWLAGLG
jgi:hypothetical protein